MKQLYHDYKIGDFNANTYIHDIYDWMTQEYSANKKKPAKNTKYKLTRTEKKLLNQFIEQSSEYRIFSEFPNLDNLRKAGMFKGVPDESHLAPKKILEDCEIID